MNGRPEGTGCGGRAGWLELLGTTSECRHLPALRASGGAPGHTPPENARTHPCLYRIVPRESVLAPEGNNACVRQAWSGEPVLDSLRRQKVRRTYHNGPQRTAAPRGPAARPSRTATTREQARPDGRAPCTLHFYKTKQQTEFTCGHTSLENGPLAGEGVTMTGRKGVAGGSGGPANLPFRSPAAGQAGTLTL